MVGVVMVVPTKSAVLHLFAAQCFSALRFLSLQTPVIALQLTCCWTWTWTRRRTISHAHLLHGHSHAVPPQLRSRPSQRRHHDPPPPSPSGSHSQPLKWGREGCRDWCLGLGRVLSHLLLCSAHRQRSAQHQRSVHSCSAHLNRRRLRTRLRCIHGQYLHSCLN